MKKQILFALGFLIAATAALAQPGPGPSPQPSQWSTNGLAIYYSLGNVGFGTSAPDAPIHDVTAAHLAAGAYGTVSVKTSNYTITNADFVVEVNASGGAVTITYPVSLLAGKPVYVIKTDTSANVVSISDGTNVVDVLTQPAGATGQIGSWRQVYRSGSSLRTIGNSSTSYLPVVSVNALTSLGAASPAIAHATVIGYVAGTYYGGGNFDWATTCPGTTNTGTLLAANGVVSGCWVRQGVTTEYYAEWFGATNDGGHSQCSASASSTALTCAPSTFIGAYPKSGQGSGYRVTCKHAGAAVPGGYPATLNTTVSAASGLNITLAVATTTAITNQVCAWGTDNTSTINAASQVAQTAGGVLLLSYSTYLSNGFRVGTGNTYANNVWGVGAPYIFNTDTGHTNACLNVGAGTFNVQHITLKNLNFDCMNTGLDGRLLRGNQPTQIENVVLSSAYRNCESFVADDISYNQQITETSTRVGDCGLHGRYANSQATNTNPTTNSSGFQDEVAFYDRFDGGFSYNGMALVGQAITSIANNGSGAARLTVPSTTGYTTSSGTTTPTHVTVVGTSASSLRGVWAVTVVDGTHLDLVGSTYTASTGGRVAPSEQLGAPEYHIVTGNAANNFQYRWHNYGAIEIDLDTDGVAALGSAVNPNFIFIADGKLPHVIEGAGNAGALVYFAQSWIWMTPTMEVSAGAASTGSIFAQETSGLTPNSVTVVAGTDSGGAANGYYGNIQWNANGNCIQLINGIQNYPSYNSTANERCGYAVSVPVVQATASASAYTQQATSGPVMSVETNGPTFQCINYGTNPQTQLTCHLLGPFQFDTTFQQKPAPFTVAASASHDFVISNATGVAFVQGSDGTNSFMDIVSWGYFRNPVTVSTGNVLGTPATRTYTLNGGTGYPQVTMGAGGGPYSVVFSMYQ